MIFDVYVEDMIYPLDVECSCARFQRIFVVQWCCKIGLLGLNVDTDIKKCQFIYLLLNKTSIFAL